MKPDKNKIRNRLKNISGIGSENKFSKKKIKTDNIHLNKWERIGRYVYRKRKIIYDDLSSSDFFNSSFIPEDFKSEDLIFFDTETTGLSGGAGTFIFLVGFAFIEKNKTVLEQVFVSDYPGESDFLNYIRKIFRKEKLYISYNGKTYDSHILKNRFLLNGEYFELENQIDLLHHSRRLWRKIIGSCTLGDIEREVLGIRRIDDVCGFEVPEIYFNYLKTGETSKLYDIFKHNYQDVLSLVKLFEVINNIINQRKDFKKTDNLIKCTFDRTNLGRYLLSGGDEKGLLYLEESFSDGDLKAGEILSLFYKRKGNWIRAIDIWKELVIRKNTFAAIELAKYYEHKVKDFHKALGYVEKIYHLDSNIQFDLNKRKNRILYKIKKRG